MTISCEKCNNPWTSVGFPGIFGFHSNYDRYTIFGQLTLFRQQCKTCKAPLWPACDVDVLKCFLRAIKLRIEAKGGRARRTIDEKETHKRELCEGCDVGVCRFAPKEAEGRG